MKSWFDPLRRTFETRFREISGLPVMQRNGYIRFRWADRHGSYAPRELPPFCAFLAGTHPVLVDAELSGIDTSAVKVSLPCVAGDLSASMDEATLATF